MSIYCIKYISSEAIYWSESFESEYLREARSRLESVAVAFGGSRIKEARGEIFKTKTDKLNSVRSYIIEYRKYVRRRKGRIRGFKVILRMDK